MFCLIQFYVQLREPLAEHKLFIKIVAIKLVVFLSFWQASAISVGTSTLKIVHPNKVLAYPDLKVGIPALLLCVEMACFAVLHLWAFPYAPYVAGAPATFYPVPDADKGSPTVENGRSPPSGGFMGLLAIFDALNLWDFVKAFGRGMRWLFCGVKRRKEDVSYKLNRGDALDMDNLPEGKEGPGTYDATRPGPGGAGPAAYGGYLGPAQQFGRQETAYHGGGGIEENVALIDNAQPNPEANSYRRDSPSPPRRPRRGDSPPYGPPPPHAPQESHRPQPQQAHYGPYQAHGQTAPPPGARTDAQARMGEALWGPR